MSKNTITPDWAKIRAEYVNGIVSLTALAQKYGVSNGSVKAHSAKEKWSEERKKKQKRKADKVVEELYDKDVRQTVKDVERCCKAAGKLIDKINKGINEVDKAIYTSTESNEIEELTRKGNDGETNVTKTKHKRNIKTKRFNTLVDTKKIAELSKSLLNIKQILTGTENQTYDENCGIIEIPAMQELQPPDESEESSSEQ